MIHRSRSSPAPAGRYDAPLFFANIGDLRERVHMLLAVENQAYPDSPVRWFVLNVEANIEIDLTAADGLRELARELADSGIHLGLARVKNDLYTPLHRAGVIDTIGTDMLFATLPVAEERYLRWALAHEPAQPAETPAEMVDHEPATSLLPWHRPEPDAESAADPSDDNPPDRRGPR
jgi:SulP family sulfate permease